MAPDADVARVRDLDGAAVVDATSRMLLVEGGGEALRKLVESLPDWVMTPEQAYPIPDARATIERPVQD